MTDTRRQLVVEVWQETAGPGGSLLWDWRVAGGPGSGRGITTSWARTEEEAWDEAAHTVANGRLRRDPPPGSPLAARRAPGWERAPVDAAQLRRLLRSHIEIDGPRDVFGLALRALDELEARRNERPTNPAVVAGLDEIERRIVQARALLSRADRLLGG